ncbi:MAG: sigma-54-dependent Fis family transcriptional regulator [Pirellulales bacterium]|nr:sigma-54-dependent Fis family transcriptional regulator [Pirellulales bacterium]
MTQTSSWQDFMQLLLAQVAESEGVEDFFEQVLPAINSMLAVDSVAVVRSNPPDWQVVSCVGSATAEIPAEVAAEALDKESLSQSDGWVAVPLADKHALLLRSQLGSGEVSRLQGAMAQGLATVKKQHQQGDRIRRLEKILDITHAWSQTNCTEALLVAMAEAATELLAADRASIFLWDKANHSLVGRPALGVEGDELLIPDDQGIVGQVVQSGEPRRVGGGLEDDQIARSVDQQTGYHTQTILCVPLVFPSGKCLGAFEVLNKRSGRFSEEDERGLQELAAHAAVALENTQHLEELLSKHQLLVEEAAEGVQLIGDSAAIEAVRSTTRRIADTDLAILILGGNGTGKEVVARSIHYLSRRREQPFIAVNCAALTETLLESELFGHEKGAFTDAHDTRAGKFELATGGTLFLDEIGDMSLSGQAKLLRVLEDKVVVRVGGSVPIHTEVRILAATNQDLGKMVREKKFREDLFFRLNVVSLDLPPLRQRGNDILILAEFFLAGFCQSMGRRTPSFSAAAKKQLLAHAWPGNVRELRNLMERLAYLSAGNRVEVEDLAFIDAGGAPEVQRLDMGSTLSEASRDFQREYIRQMIDTTQGNMSQAAQRLGLHRSNLYRKMRQLGMEADEE